MQSHPKVTAVLCLLVASVLAAGEESADGKETTVLMLEEESKQASNAQEEKAASSDTKEKRGLFRLTGVLGENSFLYTVPQAAPAPYIKPYAFSPAMAAQGSYSHNAPVLLPATPYAAPTPYNAPNPYAATTPMILLMMPPHPGNPYGSLMLVPAGNVFPQFTPNHIPLPYTHRPLQQFVPAAHFKDSGYQQKAVPVSQASVYQSYQEYPQKTATANQASVYPNYQDYTQKTATANQASVYPNYQDYSQKTATANQAYQNYQDSSSSEEQDQPATTSTRQYVKG